MVDGNEENLTEKRLVMAGAIFKCISDGAVREKHLKESDLDAAMQALEVLLLSPYEHNVFACLGCGEIIERGMDLVIKCGFGMRAEKH